MKSKPVIQDLITFLASSPTAWHAVDNIRQRLISEKFEELFEEDTWKIKHGGKYFVIRNGSTLCAFIVPKKNPKTTLLLGSHSDSPALKLKPNPEFRKENMIMLGVEIYGAPLLSSWLNRDLGIAGRVISLDSKNKIEHKLVNFIEAPVIIPQLAIHLDREVNEKGLILNKQDHLSALAGLRDPNDSTPFLEPLLNSNLGKLKVLNTELFLYPTERPNLIGKQGEFLAAYRIDNLASAHATVLSLTEMKKTSNETLNMIAVWDNEEVGSSTAQGAGSPFIPQIIERILLSLNMNREDYFRLISQSLCVSLDLTHALHPNYIEKHEPRHQPLFGKGVVQKHNAQQRYASDASSAAAISATSFKHNLPLQQFVNRTDMPGGTTIGPIHATLTGMKTVDIGTAQLSMHSAREIIACEDHIALCKFLNSLLEDLS